MITPETIAWFTDNILRVKVSLTYNQLNQLLIPSGDFRLVGWYGKGQHGIVFQIEYLKEKGGIYALKVFNAQNKSDDEALRESRIQVEFARYNMAPQIRFMDVHTVSVAGREVRLGRVIMDPIYCTFLQYLTREKDSHVKKIIAALKCLLTKKYLLEYPFPYLHSDMHFNNIVILKDKKTLGFIDFGLTVPKPAALQVLDVIPLVMSLKRAAEFYSGGDRGRPIDECSREVVNLFNQFFRVNYEWERFETHPSGAYQYRAPDGQILHSYDWAPNPQLQQTALPSEELVRQVFPSMDLPQVRE
jgi:tRNA A-37 threonylcarbamoyl transferase component Bud32